MEVTHNDTYTLISLAHANLLNFGAVFGTFKEFATKQTKDLLALFSISSDQERLHQFSKIWKEAGELGGFVWDLYNSWSKMTNRNGMPQIKTYTCTSVLFWSFIPSPPFSGV